MKSLKSSLMLCLVGAALILVTPPAAAHHDLCPANIHMLGSGASGTVWDGNDDHWLLVVTGLSAIVTLTPNSGDGDADLQILDLTCTLTIDSSANGGDAEDQASAPVGVWEVRVHYFSDMNGDDQVGYSLSVA